MTTPRTVLVTGATRGIGAAIAAAFEAEGAEVWVTGTNAEQVAELDRATTTGRRYVHADFSDRESTLRFAAWVEGLDRLDVCVNNAGINIIKPLAETVIDEFDRLTDINYRAPYLVCRAAAQVMMRQRRGHIVNIASIWSVVTKAGRSQYIASKSGLAGITRGVATDLAPYGVVVNTVSPGFTLTDLTRSSLSDAEIEAIGAQIPMRRMAHPEEIARVVTFLASPANTYLTGQNIVVDGGFSNV